MKLSTNSCNLFEKTPMSTISVNSETFFQISTNNNIMQTFCLGSPLYDDLMDAYTVYKLPNCYFEIFPAISNRLYQCLQNRSLLFLGDSTIEHTIGFSLIKYYLNYQKFKNYRIFNINDSIHNIQIYYHYNGGYPVNTNHMGLASFSLKNNSFFKYKLDPIYFNNNKLCITEVVLVCFIPNYINNSKIQLYTYTIIE